MKNQLKKVLSLMLAVLTLVCIIPMHNDAKAASVAFPNVTSSAYCEFVAAKKLDVFTAYQIGKPTPRPDSSLSIAKGTTCHIYGIDTSAGYLKVKNTKNNKTGYVALHDVFESNRPFESITSKADVKTYYKDDNAYNDYGYISATDNVYTLSVFGDYAQVIYPVGSHWKLAWTTVAGYKAVKGIPFVDVTQNDSSFAAIAWANDRGIVTGTSKTEFSPEAACTRAQVVTFLWRYAGSPKPTSNNISFGDVDDTAFYYKAMLWAVENGITNGTDATHFSPDATCTRAQVVTFLWRYAGSPTPKTSSSFVDVKPKAFYYNAMLWAVENGITNGTNATHFSPDATCTRAQVVTFLYRHNFLTVAQNEVGKTNGDFYGNHISGWANGNPWCAAFVSWCARQCGISTDIIPDTACCVDFYKCSSKKNKYHEFKNVSNVWKVDQEPKPGWLVLFKTSLYNDNSYFSHVGIVYKVETRSDGHRILTTIEGNCGGCVKTVDYDIGTDGRGTAKWGPNWIVGYCEP